MAPSIKSVGVVGTGVIGASWTALFLSRGLKVLVCDPAPDAETTLAAHLKTFWPSLQEIGLAPEASLSNYRFVGASLQGHYDEVDFIQESAPERPAIKTNLLAEIDAGTRQEVVIASSSSGIPSSQFISRCQHHPERILIGHPFNPPHLMPLVEVVPHPGTSQNAIEQALQVYSFLGKRPVYVKQELPGHVANRLQAALINEAYSLVASGIVSATDLDACITTSIGPRWALVGPFFSNVSAGGGGRGGFKHTFQHMIPNMQGWLRDMNARQVEYSDTLYEKLQESVNEQLDTIDYAAVESQRDELLVRLLKEKKAAPALV